MEIFREVAVLIGLAAALGIIANKLKQPLILGYIAAGIILQSTDSFTHLDQHSLELFSQIGIVFLLFILGLDLNTKDLKRLGSVSLATGIGQIVFTVIVGFVLAVLLGFNPTVSLFIAISLTFSSTIVIVKLLSQKNDMDSLYGKISVGFLLVQDLAAIIILIMLSTLTTDGGNASIIEQLVVIGAKGVVILVMLYGIDKLILPTVIRLTNHDREVLFISMIAWALVFAALVSHPIFGFSLEIGALAAGIALSSRKESLQIESWTRPLRDFFITVFFVLLGFQIELGSINEVLVPSVLFSVFVLIGNPIIVMIILGLLGYNSRSSFFAGLTVAQISEFSLLVINMGLANGQVTNAEVTMLTIVGGITMTLSSYMIFYNEWLYLKLKRFLVVFEFRKGGKGFSYKRTKGRIVLFGMNRLATQITELIENKEKKFLVVETDPKVIAKADKLGATTAFGDLSDYDLLKSLKLENSELIVSTVPDKTANLNLLYFAQQTELNVPVVVPAFDLETYRELYEAGADYVVYPYLHSSQRLARLIVNDSTIEDNFHRISSREKKLVDKHFL